jgi:MFS superfamily sulfate permease-like transporter
LAELRKYGWSEVGIYLATLVTIVATDLLTGVIVGIALSSAKLLFTFAHLQTELREEVTTRRVHLKLSGAATFLRLPRLAAALERVPADSELHADLEHLHYIDHACLELLTNWAKQHEAAGGTLVIDWDSLHAQFRNDVTVFRTRAVA